MHPTDVGKRLFRDDRLPAVDLETVACPLCASNGGEPVGVGYDFEYATTGDAFAALRCAECDLVYLERRPAASELSVVYPDTYHAFEFDAEHFGLAFKVRSWLEARRLGEWTRGLPETARILDVGCGDGFHLELLRRSNVSWRLEGLDVDARAVEAVRRRGFDVHQDAIEEAELPERAYDLVMLIATIEHVADPLAVLRRVRRLLVPGGRLGIITDNTDTPAFRWFSTGYWGGYHFPRHLQLFDPPSLGKLAERVGLETERVTTATSPVNWSYSARNTLVSHEAPQWLVRRFSLDSPASLAVFTLVDDVCRRFGRGTLIRASYRCPLEHHKLPDPSANSGDQARAPRVGTGVDAHEPVILGAGFAGLTAAAHLKRHGVNATVLEAAPQVGGLARSFRDEDGFSYDFGAHFITNRLAAMLGVSAECRIVRRYDESVLLDGRIYHYPFGLLRSAAFLGSALTAAARTLLNGGPAENAAEWFRARYGKSLADRVAIPLVEAWSGAPADELAPSVGDKLPGTLQSMWLKLASRLGNRAVGCGYSSSLPENWNVWHVYPRAGVGSVISGMAAVLEDRIRLGSPVERIHVEDSRVRGVTSKGEFVAVDTVFSTAPVHILARLVDGADLDYLSRFRYRPMIFVNFMLNGRGWLPSTMFWTPEERYLFFRLAEAPLSMPWLAPENHTIITADIGCEVDDPLWKTADDELADRCLEAMADIFPGIRDSYLRSRVLRTRFAYPVYLKEYEEDRKRLRRSTGIEGLYSIGRNGRFSHDLMEDVYWTTRRAVESAVSS